MLRSVTTSKLTMITKFTCTVKTCQIPMTPKVCLIFSHDVGGLQPTLARQEKTWQEQQECKHSAASKSQGQGQGLRSQGQDQGQVLIVSRPRTNITALLYARDKSEEYNGTHQHVQSKKYEKMKLVRKHELTTETPSEP